MADEKRGTEMSQHCPKHPNAIPRLAPKHRENWPDEWCCPACEQETSKHSPISTQPTLEQTDIDRAQEWLKGWLNAPPGEQLRFAQALAAEFQRVREEALKAGKEQTDAQFQAVVDELLPIQQDLRSAVLSHYKEAFNADKLLSLRVRILGAAESLVARVREEMQKKLDHTRKAPWDGCDCEDCVERINEQNFLREEMKEQATKGLDKWLLNLMLRISTDCAQTALEDAVKYGDGWVLHSQPVLQDIAEAARLAEAALRSQGQEGNT
jgi:molecular chaperone GrpE (heat shock protein)